MESVEAIYKNGIFEPLSKVPKTLKENEHVRVIIDPEERDLRFEFDQWEKASDEDFSKLEKSLGENS